MTMNDAPKKVALSPRGRNWASRRYEMNDVIHNRENFTSSSAMSGEWFVGTDRPHVGVLPHDEVAKLRASGDGVTAVYVVYSYSTPIAWWTEEHGWHIPDTKYSATTSKHQSVVRTSTGDPYWR